jgi:hypothetical protein
MLLPDEKWVLNALTETLPRATWPEIIKKYLEMNRWAPNLNPDLLEILKKLYFKDKGRLRQG